MDSLSFSPTSSFFPRKNFAKPVTLKKNLYICNAEQQISKSHKITNKEHIRRNMDCHYNTKTRDHCRGVSCNWFLFTHISVCKTPRHSLSHTVSTALPFSSTIALTNDSTQTITPMTKADIIKQIHARTGIRSSAVRQIVEEFLSTIKADMADGHNIYFRGFGSFVVKHHAEKQVYNINNGTHSIIPPHNVPTFKPGKDMMHKTP